MVYKQGEAGRVLRIDAGKKGGGGKSNDIENALRKRSQEIKRKMPLVWESPLPVGAGRPGKRTHGEREPTKKKGI